MLRVVDLGHNSLSRIESGSFDDLANLIELYLDKNCLFHVNGDFFKHIKNLQVLNLSENLIKKFSVHLLIN